MILKLIDLTEMIDRFFDEITGAASPLDYL